MCFSKLAAFFIERRNTVELRREHFRRTVSPALYGIHMNEHGAFQALSTLEHADEHLHIVTVSRSKVNKPEMLKSVAAVVKILESGFAVLRRTENSLSDKRNFEQKALHCVLKVEIAFSVADFRKVFCHCADVF